jgi:hypothetical protein
MAMLAIAVAFAVFGAVSASAQDLHQFLGPSKNMLNGGQGYFSYHQACQATFPSAVWCTTKMIIEGGPAQGVTLASDARYWVNPVPVGGLTDNVGNFVATTDTFHFDFVALSNLLTCSRWTDASENASGLVLEGSGIAGVNGTFVNRVCSNVIPAACCQGVQPSKER